MFDKKEIQQAINRGKERGRRILMRDQEGLDLLEAAKNEIFKALGIPLSGDKEKSSRITISTRDLIFGNCLEKRLHSNILVKGSALSECDDGLMQNMLNIFLTTCSTRSAFLLKELLGEEKFVETKPCLVVTLSYEKGAGDRYEQPYTNFCDALEVIVAMAAKADMLPPTPPRGRRKKNAGLER